MSGREVVRTQLRQGLDHDWFEFRTLAAPPLLRLNTRATLAVSVVVVLQQFHLERRAPFSIPGGLERPYPDLGNFTQRSSGQTQGLWRLTDTLQQAGLPVSFVLEQDALPALSDILPMLCDPTHCVVAGGQHATHLHTNEMDAQQEARVIAECVQAIEAYTGRSPQGWRSPYCSESDRTLELLAAQGISYVGDFANDDRPFAISTAQGSILSVPMNHMYSDLHSLVSCRQGVDDYIDATITASRVLAEEGEHSPAVLSLVVHPWLMGVPAYTAPFARMIEILKSDPRIEFMTTDAIQNACKELRP